MKTECQAAHIVLDVACAGKERPTGDAVVLCAAHADWAGSVVSAGRSTDAA